MSTRLDLSKFPTCPRHGTHTGRSCPRCDETERVLIETEKSKGTGERLLSLLKKATQPPIPATESPLAPPLTPKPTTGSQPTGPKRFTVTGAPMGKPRMTQRDKWKKRPNVMRYRAWADAARAAAGELPKNPGTLNWTAYLPIPKSWSKTKTALAKGQPHQQKPDRDNIDKAILDSLFESDCGIHTGTLRKLWDDGNGPRIEIEIL